MMMTTTEASSRHGKRRYAETGRAAAVGACVDRGGGSVCEEKMCIGGLLVNYDFEISVVWFSVSAERTQSHQSDQSHTADSVEEHMSGCVPS